MVEKYYNDQGQVAEAVREAAAEEVLNWCYPQEPDISARHILAIDLDVIIANVGKGDNS